LPGEALSVVRDAAAVLEALAMELPFI